MAGKTTVALALTTAVLLAACGGGGGDDDPKGAAHPVDVRCEWPMFGHDPTHAFTYPCRTEISPETAPRLERKWFFHTRDVVSSSPAVFDGHVYVGDWSGRFYALRLSDGEPLWTFDAPVHERVYAGQIVSGAAVADVGDRRLVFFGAGKTMYALDSSDGDVAWEHELNPDGPPDDPTEIESSPVVVDGLVVFGFEGHDEPGVRAGVMALDAATGEQRWYFDPDAPGPATGCVGVWGSPTVDVERRLVVVGSASCPSGPGAWGKYSEAIYALDLDRGTPRWSFQPRGIDETDNDFDFAGAPNLFTAGGHDLVGLGGKDGWYYALDRETGELRWKRQVVVAEADDPNFSTGGFIGATATDDGVIAGGTAVGSPCPCIHGLDAATGEIIWEEPQAGPTFAPSAIANGVLFLGSTTDFTLRALDLRTGKVLWSEAMPGGITGGPAVVGDTLVAVVGVKEPGVRRRSDTAGVAAFVVGEASSATSTTVGAGRLAPTTAAPPPTDPPAAPADGPECVASACDIRFGWAKKVPEGLAPSMTLHVRPEPFRLEVRGDGLGDPEAWLRPDGPAIANGGAVTYGVFLTKSDDDPRGTLVCVLDGDSDCVTDELPSPLEESYSRMSVLAIADRAELPEVAEGFDRLVATVAFDPPLALG